MQDDQNTPPPSDETVPLQSTPPTPEVEPQQLPVAEQPYGAPAPVPEVAPPPVAPIKSPRSKLIKVLSIAVVTIVLVGGLFLIMNFLFGLNTKKLTNDGYDYSFKFNAAAQQVQMGDKSAAYKYHNGEIALIEPTTESLLTNCSKVNGQWSEAFTVQLSGTTEPVCQSRNAAFIMVFAEQGSNHLFTITFDKQQSASSYSRLKSIFSSVTVSQQ